MKRQSETQRLAFYLRFSSGFPAQYLKAKLSGRICGGI